MAARAEDKEKKLPLLRQPLLLTNNLQNDFYNNALSDAVLHCVTLSFTS
jgi:hypothetical protein